MTLRRWIAIVGGIVLLIAGVLVVRNQVRVASKRAASRAAALAAAEATRQRLEAAARAPEDVRKRRVELFGELQPVTLRNCEFTRVGGPNDGGYLLCRNLMHGLETAYSYGIGGEDAWGCEVSRTHRVPVHEYDCFSPTKVLCEGGDLRLNAECVGPRKETLDGRPFDTLAAQIARNGDAGRQMVVKVDVEGAEWDAILATPDDVLASISQLPMELHGVDDPKVLAGLRKLKQHFHLVSIHFNNQACAGAYMPPMPAEAYQVLFVNKRIGVLGEPPAGRAPAESFMAPDDPTKPDCQAVRR